MKNLISVLAVDDSALVRQSLTEILTEDEGFELTTASNPIFAQKKIEKKKPDVIILDIEMPEMDGITYLEKIMSSDPIPVVICSGVSQKGSYNALRALEIGAVEIIEKPKMGTKQFIEESRFLIQDAVRAAASITLKKVIRKAPLDMPKKKFEEADITIKKEAKHDFSKLDNLKVAPKLTADAILDLPKTNFTSSNEKIIVVGASTGGTEALREFLQVLPENLPPILIVQHMPKHFTKAFADRLNSCCPPKIMEATNNQEAKRGEVYIAPGDSHMILKHTNGKYMIEVKEGPLVCRHRPSVDVLFRSAARYAGKNVIGVILTGMGDDGARGMQEMKENGAVTIAQDENSCIVYGMPKEAVKRGAVDFIMSLEKIPEKVISLSNARF